MRPEIRIVATAQELQAAGAEEFAREAEEAVRARGRFTVALSGGSTPRGLYALLAEDPGLRARVPWAMTHVFWGDERHVPPDEAESNYRMAWEAMLSRVPVPPGQVHRIRGEHPEAARAADEYEETLSTAFGLGAGQRPRLDLVLLGLGPDGHTASLFPGTRALREERRLVVANWVGKLWTERITVTVPVLNSARRVVFLVAGTDKAMPLKAVLDGPLEPEQLPAQLIRPESGRLLWIVDRYAARLL
jgi:6-phosphogluconolactonase